MGEYKMGLKGYSLGTQFSVWSALESEEHAAVKFLIGKVNSIQTAFTKLSTAVAWVYNSYGQDADDKYVVPVSKSLEMGDVLRANKDALEQFRDEFRWVTRNVDDAADLLTNTFYTEYRAFGKTFGGSGKTVKTKMQYADALRKVKITMPLLNYIETATLSLDRARSILEPACTDTDTYKAVSASIIEAENLKEKILELNNNLLTTENMFRAKQPEPQLGRRRHSRSSEMSDRVR